MRHKFWLDYVVHPIKRHLARMYLALLQAKGTKVVGITGSYGKTTTKNMLAAILSEKFPTYSTEDNTDSVYNIPNTILHTPFNTKYLILEMSIEFPGEMHFYLWLAKPEIAIITGISMTHTEFLKDTETISQEKSLIGKYAHTVLVNSQDPKIKVVTSGKTIKVKTSQFSLPAQLVGKQFNLNASLAAAAAKLIGVSDQIIEKALSNVSTAKHRMQIFNHSSGATIIDDVHNANPQAVRLSLEALIGEAKKENKTPVLAFGQMNEMGSHESQAHSDVGKQIKKLGIRHLLTIGPATKYTISAAGLGKLYTSNSKLLTDLKKYLSPKYIILVKGSRSWHLEEVVEKIAKTTK